MDATNKAAFYAVVRVSLWAAFVLFLPYYLWQVRSSIEEIASRTEPFAVVILCLNIVLSWFLRAARDSCVYRKFGSHISLVDLLFLNARQLLLNYLPMKLGTVQLALELRQVHHLNFAKFGGALLVQHIFTGTVAAAIACVALICFGSPEDFAHQTMAAGFGFFAAILTIFLFAPFRFAWVSKRIAGSRDVFRGISNDALMYLAYLLSIGVFIMLAWRLQIICDMLQIDMSLLSLTIFATVTQLSLFFAITPGALGIREFLLGALGSVFALPISVGVIISLTERLALLSLAAVLLASGVVVRQMKASWS